MKKSQVVLELTLIFVIGFFLFFGIMSMWIWSNRQIVRRQPVYNHTRIEAGTVSGGTNKDLVWPRYTPEELTEDEVFDAQFPDKPAEGDIS